MAFLEAVHLSTTPARNLEPATQLHRFRLSSGKQLFGKQMKAASTYVINEALAAVSQNGTSLRHCAEPLRDDQAGAEAKNSWRPKCRLEEIDRKIGPNFRHMNHVQHQSTQGDDAKLHFSGGVPGSCAAKWPCFASCFGDAAEQQRGGGCSTGELHGGTTLRGSMTTTIHPKERKCSGIKTSQRKSWVDFFLNILKSLFFFKHLLGFLSM